MDYRAFGIPLRPSNNPLPQRSERRVHWPDYAMVSWSASRNSTSNRRLGTRAVASPAVPPTPGTNTRSQRMATPRPTPRPTQTSQATRTTQITQATRATQTSQGMRTAQMTQATRTTQTIRTTQATQVTQTTLSTQASQGTQNQTLARETKVACGSKQPANQSVPRLAIGKVLPPVDVHLGPKLGDLVEDLCHVLATYEFLLRDFERAIEGVQGFTEESMLNVMWMEKISQTYYRTGQKDKVEGAVPKIFDSTVAVRLAMEIETARRSAIEPSKRDQVDCQIRAASVVIAACDGIIDLASRAYCERTACKHLVKEIEQTVSKLDPDTHPCIYMD